jgi:hypothetical protein
MHMMRFVSQLKMNRFRSFGRWSGIVGVVVLIALAASVHPVNSQGDPTITVTTFPLNGKNATVSFVSSSPSTWNVGNVQNLENAAKAAVQKYNTFWAGAPVLARKLSIYFDLGQGATDTGKIVSGQVPHPGVYHGNITATLAPGTDPQTCRIGFASPVADPSGLQFVVAREVAHCYMLFDAHMSLTDIPSGKDAFWYEGGAEWMALQVYPSTISQEAADKFSPFANADSDLTGTGRGGVFYYEYLQEIGGTLSNIALYIQAKPDAALGEDDGLFNFALSTTKVAMPVIPNNPADNFDVRTTISVAPTDSGVTETITIENDNAVDAENVSIVPQNADDGVKVTAHNDFEVFGMVVGISNGGGFQKIEQNEGIEICHINSPLRLVASRTSYDPRDPHSMNGHDAMLTFKRIPADECHQTPTPTASPTHNAPADDAVPQCLVGTWQMIVFPSVTFPGGSTPVTASYQPAPDSTMTIDASGHVEIHMDINVRVTVAGTNVIANLNGDVAATLSLSNLGNGAFSQALLDNQQVNSMNMVIQGRTYDISHDIQNLMGGSAAMPITLMCTADTLIYGWTVPSIGPNAITFKHVFQS